MNVQNLYKINNHGMMYIPGAAQGTQCGDYNNMYMPLLHERKDRSDIGDDESQDSADYEEVYDIDVNAMRL